MLIKNLAGVFTGLGFVDCDGRRPRAEHCGFAHGPTSIAIDDSTGLIASSAASDAQIDGSGMIALPGFIDPHTHAIFAGERSHEYFMRWAGKTYLEISQGGAGIHSTVAQTLAAGDDDLRDTLRKRLSEMLACGATTVEVKSGYANSAVGELRLLRVIQSLRNERSLPEIRATFLALHALPQGRDEREYADEMIAALGRVQAENLAAHVDAFPEKGFFTLDASLRFAQAARKFKLPAKIHADELSDLGSSAAFIRSGAMSIDHLQCISAEAVDLLSGSPTVATMLPATSFFVGLPYANARRLTDAGAKVALATDFNPGTAPAMDLQLTHMLGASQMKMTAAEILCATTYNAACALGLGKSHGAIAPGRAGDVLLYEARSGDPIATLEEIILSRRRPAVVVRRGQRV